MRNARFRALRAAGASGYELTRALDRYSERRGEYGETLRMIIRANRLALLSALRAATGTVADFSKITG